MEYDPAFFNGEDVVSMGGGQNTVAVVVATCHPEGGQQAVDVSGAWSEGIGIRLTDPATGMDRPGNINLNSPHEVEQFIKLLRDTAEWVWESE